MIIKSLGKSFLVKKIAKSIKEANEFLETHPKCGVLRENGNEGDDDYQVFIAENESLESQYFQLGSRPSLNVWMTSLPGPARIDYQIEWIDGETYGIKAPKIEKKQDEVFWVVFERSVPEFSRFNEHDLSDYKIDWFFDFEEYNSTEVKNVCDWLKKLELGVLVDLGKLFPHLKGFEIVKTLKQAE